MSCSKEESETSTTEPAEKQDNAGSAPANTERESQETVAEPAVEKTAKPITETILLIPRIWITCLDKGWFILPDVHAKHEVTCDKGTPVCGRRASADPQSEPKPYCVIGDPSKKESAKLTMIPAIVASPYCKKRFPVASLTKRNKIICFQHKGDSDSGEWQYD